MFERLFSSSLVARSFTNPEKTAVSRKFGIFVPKNGPAETKLIEATWFGRSGHPIVEVEA
jgi:hypothetical protein